MSRTVHRGIRQCPCRDCRESPKSATAEQHRTINRVVASFDEKGETIATLPGGWDLAHAIRLGIKLFAELGANS